MLSSISPAEDRISSAGPATFMEEFVRHSRPRSWRQIVTVLSMVGSFALLVSPSLAQETPAQIQGWPGHARDAQHSSLSSVAAQPLNKIHWQTPVDLNPGFGEILIHYGSPLITPAGTVIVPVKTGPNNFRIEAHNQATGALLWQQNTSYQVPASSFTPSFSPVLSHNKLYVPGSGGTVQVRQNPDQATGKILRLVFYGADNFNADPKAYNQSVKISTPITADSQGNIYFGFVVSGPNPIGLKSGLARISATGQGSFVTATAATSDTQFSQVATSCAPALSPDESMVYVTMVNPIVGLGDLVALDSHTLQTITVARLKDPSSGFDAEIFSASSAAPTVGPDGDVYFGVIENPFPLHNDRGWLLHFNSTLTQQKIPGSFGWDDTPSIVTASLVPSYHGTSKYLIMSKYNNYAGIGSGDGVNKIAILDPNATEADPVLPATLVMNEVLTIKGVTRDPNFPSLPAAVREWCINSAAVDPVNKSVLANSEDGKLYRWDLTTNSFSQVITLSGGIGEAYTPTVIGSDGTAFAINDAVLFAIGR
jgi:hypothetical protein